MAHAALAGIDPRAWLYSESDVELAFLRRVAERAMELNGRYRQDFANRTISLLAKTFSKGNRGKGK